MAHEAQALSLTEVLASGGQPPAQAVARYDVLLPHCLIGCALASFARVVSSCLLGLFLSISLLVTCDEVVLPCFGGNPSLHCILC